MPSSPAPDPRVPLSRAAFDQLINDGNPLTELNLSGLDLRDAPALDHRDLSGCNFSDARLAGARLQGATLRGCVFRRAELHGTQLLKADLRGADLSEADGLTADQLRGALLGSAKLPDGLAFDGLDRVRDLVNRADRQLHLLLLACLSLAVLAVATGHASYFLGTSSLTLPGLDLPVRLSAFYMLAPLVLLGLYTGVSFTLRKLWLELANLPGQFPNGRLLHLQAAPSSPSFTAPVARHVAERLGATERAEPERRLMVFLVWWITPLTLLVFVWGAYLPRHASVSTAWHILATLTAAAWGVASYREMGAILADRFEAGVPPRAVRRGLWERPGMAALSALAVLMIVASVWGVRGPGCRTVRILAAEGYNLCNLPGANLKGATLADWRLPGVNLRRAFAHSAHLKEARLQEADFSYANLIEARLDKATLDDARFDRTVMWEARLDSARLKEAKVRNADLRGASLYAAELQGVDFTGSDLRGVDWDSALVCGAQLTKKVDVDAFKQARGWRRANVPVLPYEPDTLVVINQGKDTVPPYLSGRDVTEYLRWRRAWRAMQARPEAGIDVGTRIAYRDIHAFLDTIDVSMGAARQREKERALAILQRLARQRGDSIVVSGELDRAVDKLRLEVRRKAVNHCVDVGPALPTRSARAAGAGAARAAPGGG